jgi:Putative Flp pilus-assembly TadE/G-like
MAGAMIGIVLIAALVFDVGQNLLDRRNQQNAADAAALAGARFLALPACKPVGGVQPACSAAVAAAVDIAARNGYVDGVDGHTVAVHIPPDPQSEFSGFPGHIQVVLGGTRGSFFAGVIGDFAQNVATQSVAANIEDFSLPFALLALNPADCNAGHITGNGVININADIQVNSTCDSSGALTVGGAGATVNAASATCATSGTIQVNSGSLNCNKQEGVDPKLFPAIGGPSVPAMPLAPVITGTGSLTIPDGCPGASGGGRTPSTALDPKGCKFQYNQNKEVRIYPGVYWGGLEIRETGSGTDMRVYMEPGVYYIAGGGFHIVGDPVVRSVHPAGTTFDVTSPSMGVLIYNTDDPQYHDTCVLGTGAGNQCISSIDFQTGVLSDVDLRGDKVDTAFKNLLLFQDPGASLQPAVSMEGHSSQTLDGTIYIPEANFKYTGNGSGEILNTQIICSTFEVKGGGELSINYDAGAVYQFKGIGLVQ